MRSSAIVAMTMSLILCAFFHGLVAVSVLLRSSRRGRPVLNLRGALTEALSASTGLPATFRT